MTTLPHRARTAVQLALQAWSIITVAARLSPTVALRVRPPSSRPTFIPKTLTATAICTANSLFSCAVDDSERVRCWGANFYGQVYGADDDAVSTPFVIENVQNARSVYCGESHACALTSSGETWCWGTLLGDAPDPPTRVQGVPATIDACAARYYSCVLGVDGSTWCWGSNLYGTLGRRDETDLGFGTPLATPKRVAGLPPATKITCGPKHACAILSDDGRVACWGFSNFGQIPVDGGAEFTGVALAPVTSASLANATSVAAGGWHTCATTRRGTLVCTGWNEYGQLGLGGAVQSESDWTRVPRVDNAAEVVAGSTSTAVRLRNGTTLFFGQNAFGIGGFKKKKSTTAKMRKYCAGRRTRAVSLGSAHSCFVDSKRRARCVGSNDAGSLGIGKIGGTFYAPLYVLA